MNSVPYMFQAQNQRASPTKQKFLKSVIPLLNAISPANWIIPVNYYSIIIINH